MQDIESVLLDKTTAVLIVSDIHLRLPVTRELGMIQNSLVDRIGKLSKNPKAMLVLNGDIFELWEQTDQTVADIIEGFNELTKAIQKFANKRGHSVQYVVGNHDEILATSPTDRAVVEHHWRAQVTNQLELSYGSKRILIQHGHQYDPYNMPSESHNSKGKRLVQNTMPLLQRHVPRLVSNIGDVTDRSLLGEFVIGNFLYKVFMPVAAPIALLLSFGLAIIYRNQMIIIATIAILSGLIVLMIIVGLLSRLVSGLALGGGNSYMRKLDKAQEGNKFNAIALGHTHQGGIFKRASYIYANSGCNDVIATHKTGWLVLPKFERHLQMSGLTIDYSKKPAIEYHQETIPLVE